MFVECQRIVEGNTEKFDMVSEWNDRTSDIYTAKAVKCTTALMSAEKDAIRFLRVECKPVFGEP